MKQLNIVAFIVFLNIIAHFVISPAIGIHFNVLDVFLGTVSVTCLMVVLFD